MAIPDLISYRPVFREEDLRPSTILEMPPIVDKHGVISGIFPLRVYLSYLNTAPGSSPHVG